MNIGIQSDRFSSNPNEINKNVISKISLPETFSLVFLLSLTIIFSYHHHKGFYLPWDFEESYLLAGSGDYSNFFYGYWIMPIFWLLEKLPLTISFILWAFTNVMCTFIAGRVFGGKAWWAILSYQMIYVVFYGQITGLLIGGLALAWWGISSKKFLVAGLGLLISSTKPQFGLSLSFILWIMSDSSWKQKLKMLLIPTIGIIATTLAYPDWINNIFSAINSGKVDLRGNISLWQYIGPWSLIFLIPPMISKSSPEKQILFLIVASIISLPYIQQTELLALYVFPFGWLSLIGNLGFLFPFFSWEIIHLLIIVPLVIYSSMLLHEIHFQYLQ